jgi:L-threonylcarbamoyladenylate synthase
MVEKAYKDHSESGKAAPRAPGMKYKHYSPRARVVLYEATHGSIESGLSLEDINMVSGIPQKVDSPSSAKTTIGIIRTRRWALGAGLHCGDLEADVSPKDAVMELDVREAVLYDASGSTPIGMILDLSIGQDAKSVAQGLFSALRELDRRNPDLIFVEGLRDNDDIAAAVMNRLRKAASEIRS